MSSTVSAKKALRQEIKQKLKLLSSEDLKRQTNKALGNILNLPAYKSAAAISVYLSMPSGEIGTAGIIKDAFSHGKQVFVPYLHKVEERKTMDMLALRSYEEYCMLEKDSWGIPSLSKTSIDQRSNALGGLGVHRSASMGVLDLIIMPGVAFDYSLQRLGHGAGYYDSYLTRYTAHSKAPSLVGLCLDEQIVEAGSSIPTTEHDWPVDLVVTGSRTLSRVA